MKISSSDYLYKIKLLILSNLCYFSKYYITLSNEFLCLRLISVRNCKDLRKRQIESFAKIEFCAHCLANFNSLSNDHVPFPM